VRIERALQRIDELRAINAFVFVDSRATRDSLPRSESFSLERVASHGGKRRRDELLDKNASGDGLVVAVKDNIDVRGMPTTAGGRHLPTEARLRDAECVRRLRAAGCAIVGKTGLYEYAMGGTSVNPHLGDVLNPRNRDRDAGGSSSGSAAAVAAGMCDAALGTDTLGSVRVPAAFCGVVGYKPPRNAIDRRGVFVNSSSLDAVGVLAPNVRTAARVAQLVARVPARGRPPAGRRPHRLAVPWSWMTGVSDEVRGAFRRVAGELPDIELPSRELLCEVALTVARVEGTRAHLGWLRSAPDLYGDEVRALLVGNLAVPLSDYVAARRELARLRALMRRRLATVDAVLVPTVPFVPPLRARYPLEARQRLTDLTRPFNVSDSAAFSIPIPGTRLPIGLQIAANDEATAVAVALRLERGLRA
jgi:aspartyl-tRNA(Asn)/glutamyl-tRNA(Gln) amidotransferase subunit A